MITFALALALELHSAHAADDALAKLAVPLKNDQVFYRWQSTTSGENLVREGKMTSTLNRHFMNTNDKIAAGPGFYFANDALSSSEFLPVTGGNLVEVHLPKGTRILDLTDQSLVKALKKAGITTEALHDGAHAESGLVLKYADTWYVGKNLGEQVRFAMWPSAKQTIAKVEQVSEAATRSVRTRSDARDQIARQIHQAPPEIQNHLFADDPLHPIRLSNMTPQEFDAALKKTAAGPTNPREVLRILGFLGQNPEKLQALRERSQALAGQLADRAAEQIGDRLLSLDHEVFLPLIRLAAVGAKTDPVRQARLLSLASIGLKPTNLQSQLTIARRRVVAILHDVDLTETERAGIARSIAAATSHLSIDVDQASEFSHVISVAKITDPAVLEKVERLGETRERVKRAMHPSSMDELVDGFRGHENYTNFSKAWRSIYSQVPDAEVREGFNRFATLHPAEFSSLFRSGDSLVDAMYAAQNFGEVPFKLYYEALKHASAEQREQILTYFVWQPEVAVKLAPLVKADGGQAFSELPKLSALADSVRHLNESDPNLARSMLEVILNSSAPRDDRMKLLKNVKVGKNSMTDVTLKVPKDQPVSRATECLTKLSK